MKKLPIDTGVNSVLIYNHMEMAPAESLASVVNEQSCCNPSCCSGKKPLWLKIVIHLLAVILLLSLGLFASNLLIKEPLCSPCPACPQAKVIPPTPTTVVQLPTVTPSTNPTAEWKTYTNGFTGFKFQYPSRLSINILQGEDPTKNIHFYGNSKNDSIHLTLASFEGTLTQFVNQEKKSTIFDTDYGRPVKFVKEIDSNIGKMEWYKTSTNNDQVYFIIKGVGILLYTQISDTTEIDQILSTFRFLE